LHPVRGQEPALRASGAPASRRRGISCLPSLDNTKRRKYPMTEHSQASAVATTGRVVRAQVAELADSLRDVDAAQWDAPSACTDWAIGDVAAHMAESNDRFLQIIEATLAGAEVPAFSPQERAARQAAVKAAGSAAVLAQLQQRVGAVFDRLENASPDQLAR